MRRNLFWLSDAQWPRIVPLLADGRARQGTGRRSAGHQRHPACAAKWLPLEGLSAGVWSLHDRLQSLCDGGPNEAFGSICSGSLPGAVDRPPRR